MPSILALPTLASPALASLASLAPALQDSASPPRTLLPQAPEFYVGWGTLAILTAGVAQGKNRSGLNWFLLGLLLGPIATFVLVAFFDKLPAER